jgi:hypothetical protein
MKIHANATLGPKGRLVICRRVLEQGWSLTPAAEAAGLSERTAGKWTRRYRSEGEVGLLDRSSAPRRIHNPTIAALRRVRLTGPEIAEVLEMPTSTVSAVLERIGLGKLSRLEPQEPIRRYEKRRPGELIHIDVKKLGRIGTKGAGHRALGTSAFYRSHGITVERVMTDNGSAYVSTAHSLACRTLGIRHLRTQPSRAGSSATTTGDDMAPSVTGPRSLGCGS